MCIVQIKHFGTKLCKHATNYTCTCIYMYVDLLHTCIQIYCTCRGSYRILSLGGIHGVLPTTRGVWGHAPPPQIFEKMSILRLNLRQF